MTDQRGAVVAGVDAHTDEHHIAAVDAQGRLLGTAAFATTAEGYARLIGWLSVARAGALKARTAALQQLDDLVITAPEQLRGELRRGRTLKAKAALCLHLRPDSERIQEPAQAAKLALRSLARRIRVLERE